ncbi:hypothetical protein R6Q59_012973 [Mikania micrantha]
MADLGEEDEYESDPEQAKLSLKMQRRREASDDDDDARVRGREMVNDSRVSDYEYDGVGAASEYDDEELVEEVGGVIEGGNDRADGGRGCVDQFDDNADGQGEKKKNEPFAVPTEGAFYMHDDRFGERAGRRALGDRKLRDDSKWGHDKFEEMTGLDRHYDERRRGPRGRNRARGRNQGEGRGYPKNYKNDNNNQMNGHKSVRGRGPRRYQSSIQNTFETPAQSRQSAKPSAKTSHASSGRASAATSTLEPAHVTVRKNVASNLDSASSPFYPSGSSNKETNLTQKKDAQSGSFNQGPHPPVMAENYPNFQSNIPRGRNISVSVGMEKLYIDDSISKPLINLQSRSVGRGPFSFGQVAYQPVPSQHINRRNLHPSGQQFGARSAGGSRASSPPTASGHTHGSESIDVESSTEFNDSKTVLVGKGKGKGSIPISGMGSFSYGDQNFSGAPTFLPVMQLAGQHPHGLGVPAVGMAFPGYVGRPNGMGNSEMTWLPVLAGAAGALGAAGLGAPYQYITMDGAYNAHSCGQPSSIAHINKDNIMNKSSSEVKPSQKPEVEKDELRQRQNKARRYTEMKFDK